MMLKDKENPNAEAEGRSDRLSLFTDSFDGLCVETTKRCNFRCRFCYASSNRSVPAEPRVTDEMIERVASEVRRNNLAKVTISGGEPLIDRELLMRVLRAMRKTGAAINLNTNLSLITDDLAEELTEYLDPETYAFTSLLSPVEERCDAVTGVSGSWRRVLNGIETCRGRNIPVSVNFTISRDNVCDVEAIEGFASKYAVDRVSISQVIPPSYDRDSETNRLRPDEIKRIADALVGIHERLGIPVASSHPLPLCVIGDDGKYDAIESAMCRTGWNYCAVSLFSGRVFACSQEEKDYGNIYEDPLAECLMRMRPDHGIENLAEKCRNCSLLRRCGGECRWSSCGSC